MAFNCFPEVLAEQPRMVALRRHFHAHPELSFQEHATAARVAAELRATPGVTGIVEGVGRTGVVALIVGGAGAGPCIGLRADMDALPIVETGDCPFISQTPGVMHACGCVCKQPPRARARSQTSAMSYPSRTQGATYPWRAFL